MATPVGESADVGEIPLWDWYLIIFSILVSVIVSTGVVLLWCVNFLKEYLVTGLFCARKSTSVQQLMRKISDLDEKDQHDLRQKLMAKTNTSEIDTLSEKNVHLRKQIAELRKSQGGSKPSSFTVYVTKTGNCFHLDPDCQHLRQSSVQKMPCQICVN